jgi:hypothetical protein
MWASSASDIYLADGMLHHFDGSRWRDLNVPAELVFGTKPSDVYVASTKDNKSIRHYDGQQWSLLRELGGDTNGDDDIVSIWAMDGPYLAVLRTHGISTWNGVDWTDVQFRSFDENADVWGAAPDNLYVVGNPYSSHGQIIHFDGVTWSYPTIPETPQLNSVWGATPQNIYAVGDHGAVLHYDGSSWSDVARITDKQLREVWGSGPSNVFAVGDDGKAIHFDGVHWSSIRKDKPDHHAYTIWAESATRFAVTDWIDGPTVYLYDNGRWKETYVTGARYGVRTMTGHSLEDLYVLADRDVFHFNGAEWTHQGFLDADFPGEMWFPEGSDRGFAVGGESIFQFDGGQWNKVISGQPWPMMGLWGASASSVYAINAQGLVFHYDGAHWTQVPSPAESLTDISGVSSTEVYVLGGDGGASPKVFRYSGSTWQPVGSGGTPYGEGLALTSSTNIFTWGGCAISHFDGRTWKRGECDRINPTVQIVAAKDGSILRLTDHGVSQQALGLIQP